MENNQIKTNFEVGTNKIEESVFLKTKIQEIRQNINEIRLSIQKVDVRVIDEKKKSAAIQEEIKRTDAQVLDTEANILSSKDQRNLLLTKKREIEDNIKVLGDKIKKEEEAIDGEVKKAEVMKIRTEELYNEGRTLIEEAERELEEQVPADVKQGTIELPTKDVNNYAHVSSFHHEQNNQNNHKVENTLRTFFGRKK